MYLYSRQNKHRVWTTLARDHFAILIPFLAVNVISFVLFELNDDVDCEFYVLLLDELLLAGCVFMRIVRIKRHKNFHTCCLKRWHCVFMVICGLIPLIVYFLDNNNSSDPNTLNKIYMCGRNDINLGILFVFLVHVDANRLENAYLSHSNKGNQLGKINLRVLF